MFLQIHACALSVRLTETDQVALKFVLCSLKPFILLLSIYHILSPSSTRSSMGARRLPLGFLMIMYHSTLYPPNRFLPPPSPSIPFSATTFQRTTDTIPAMNCSVSIIPLSFSISKVSRSLILLIVFFIRSLSRAVLLQLSDHIQGSFFSSLFILIYHLLCRCYYGRLCSMAWWTYQWIRKFWLCWQAAISLF